MGDYRSVTTFMLHSQPQKAIAQVQNNAKAHLLHILEPGQVSHYENVLFNLRGQDPNRVTKPHLWSYSNKIRLKTTGLEHHQIKGEELGVALRVPGNGVPGLISFLATGVQPVPGDSPSRVMCCWGRRPVASQKCNFTTVHYPVVSYLKNRI